MDSPIENNTHKIKLRVIRTVKMLLLIVFTPSLLLYLGVLLPDYLAYVNCVNDGDIGRNIWGQEVPCNGENKELGIVFFQFASVFVGVLAIVLAVLFLYPNRMKKVGKG